MLNKLNFQSFLSDWDWKRRNDWFYWLLLKKKKKKRKNGILGNGIIGLYESPLYQQKKHLKRCFLSNGARYYAIIGLIFMTILRN